MKNSGIISTICPPLAWGVFIILLLISKEFKTFAPTVFAIIHLLGLILAVISFKSKLGKIGIALNPISMIVFAMAFTV